MASYKSGIDLRKEPHLHAANPYANDYTDGSFKVREDLLPLVRGILLPNYRILEREKELFARIERDYRGADPLFIPILKGAVRFSQDMFRFSKEIDPDYEFMPASSYGTRLESGSVRLNLAEITRLLEKLENRKRPVIIVEDIVDTGNTLSHIVDVLTRIDDVIDSQPELKGFRRKGRYEPSSVTICTMLNKPARRKDANKDLPVEYVGFTIPDLWVFGYGLDVWDDKSRTIDHLCVIKDEWKDPANLAEFFREVDERRKKKTTKKQD
ncbi:hypothetical protein JW898_05520 [Candidatus Woesearchaeota archaeon]|nr:hypothetical protein [Candidatus Woesearchaeota archaeon]